jgi:hypothetical protein
MSKTIAHMSKTIAHTDSDPNYVNVTRVSKISGRAHTMRINISPKDFRKGYNLAESGMYIQDAFPTLTADEREFIKTGITPEEWEKVFSE